MTQPNFHFEIHPARIGDPDDQSNWHYFYFADAPPIRAMSFKGGGTRVLVYMKFLEIAHKLGVLDDLHEVGGSSSGSLAAAFSAIYYEDPARRTEAFEEVMNCDRFDIYGESNAWKFYQVITSPLLLVSKPLEWIGKVISKVADVFNKVTISKILGIPLKIISSLFGIASTITSPRFIPACVNLISKGGVYRGDQLEKTLRNRIHKDVHAGLYSILKKLRDEGREFDRHVMIDRIVEIGLGQRKDGQLIITHEITLSHLHELSIITDHKFKSYYTTAVKLRDNSLVEINHKNFPEMPFYRAPRIAINFPRYYMPAEYDGEKYIDGGAINNAPVGLATPQPVHEIHQEMDVQKDHLSRLNVRVEYDADYKNHLWHKKAEKGRVAKFFSAIIAKIVKWFAHGVDVFATDEIVTRDMQDNYAQRTLQISDFNVGVMEENLSKNRRQKIDTKIEKRVNRYFAAHSNEKVHKRFPAQPTNESEEMPDSVRRKLFDVLCDSTIKTENIFIFPGKSAQELEAMRSREIERLKRLIPPPKYSESTSTMTHKLGGIGMPQDFQSNDNDNNVGKVYVSEDLPELQKADHESDSLLRLSNKYY